VFEQNIHPSIPSNIPSGRVRFNTQSAPSVTQIYIHQENENAVDYYNAWNNILSHVNSGNYARIVVSEDVSSPFKNRSWRITSMSYNATNDYFLLNVDSTFAPDDNIQGSGSYVALPNLMAGNSKVSVWAWRDDNANYSTNTTTNYNTSTVRTVSTSRETTFNTSTLKTISTTRSTLLQNTTRSTSKSTTTTFNTSTTTAYNTSRTTTVSTSRTTSFNTSRTTQWYTVFNTTTTYNTSTNTVEFHNTTTIYNTSRTTSTSSGGGGCFRGCI